MKGGPFLYGDGIKKSGCVARLGEPIRYLFRAELGPVRLLARLDPFRLPVNQKGAQDRVTARIDNLTERRAFTF